MKSLNTGLPRQNTKRFRLVRKEKGEVQAAVGLMFLLILCVILAAQMQIGVFGAVSHETEDALAAANLASAVIDIEEYGISRRLSIPDFEKAYAVFCDSLKNNLGLNDLWEKEDQILISGKVRVERFLVYNVSVETGTVSVSGIDGNGNKFQQTGDIGSIYAPNGIAVETTAVYSEISFPVRFFPGAEWEAHKAKLVDICSDE